jgi:hypothetical protein
MLTAVHLLLALVEFFVVNWLGSLSVSSGYHKITFVQTVEDAPLFNVAFGVLAPTVFLVLTAAIWYIIGADAFVIDYWHVTVLYIGVRWTYNVVVGRAGLFRWTNQLISAALATSVSYAVSTKLLGDRGAVLPSGRALTDELWIVVIGFVYVTATRISWPRLGPSIDEQRVSYLHRRFRALRNKFGSVVSATATSRVAEVASYSIMIYESFNRPPLYQWIENTFLFPAGLASTLGPMQISTAVRLPASELVREGVRRVNVAIDAGFEEMKGEWTSELGISLRRDPGAALQLPVEDTDSRPVTISDVPRHLEGVLVRMAASKYNIRSDYPGEIASIYAFLREYYFRSRSDRPPASSS